MKMQPILRLTISGFAAFLPLAAVADWPQYRGVAGDGKSAETRSDQPWADKKPEVLWKIEAPLGFSSFSIADGRACTLISREGREICLAVDAQTGEELWSVPLGESEYGHDGGNAGAPGNRGGDGPRSTPTMDGRHVFVYDSHLVLSCLEAADGQLVWRRDVSRDLDGRNLKWLNATSPVLDGDTIYVGGGGRGRSFLAFQKETGDLLWQSGDELLTHATPRVATIDGQKQVVYFMQSGLVSVDAATGSEIWRAKFPFSVSTAASPVISDNLVYCSAGYGVGAGLFRVAAGAEPEEVWFKPNELMNHWSTPLVHDGHLYGIFEFKKYGRAPLQCVDLKSGEIVWKQEGFGPGNCILVGDKLIVLSDTGELVVVKATPDSYQELARAAVLSGKCWSTPAYSDGRVYVRSTEEGACVELSPAQ